MKSNDCPAVNLEGFLKHLENIVDKAKSSGESKCTEEMEHMLSHVNEHMDKYHLATEEVPHNKGEINHEYYYENTFSGLSDIY